MACEITATRIFAVRSAQKGEGVDVLQVRTIIDPLTPNLMNQNFPDADAVRIVLDDALLNTFAHSKELTLVVPDAAARVVLLDFDTLPDRKAEADAVVRFRLKKTLPFDIDKAAVSYHAQPNGKTLKVVVAVMIDSVLAEYEGLVRAAGYVPGVVMPSTLAALGNIDGDTPSMVLKVAEGSTTVAIVNDDKLLFYRTIGPWIEQCRGTNPRRRYLSVGSVFPGYVRFPGAEDLSLWGVASGSCRSPTGAGDFGQC